MVICRWCISTVLYNTAVGRHCKVYCVLLLTYTQCEVADSIRNARFHFTYYNHSLVLGNMQSMLLKLSLCTY